MDYRSRQRVPNEIIGNQSNINPNVPQTKQSTTTGSSSSASSAAELNEDLNNPLSSLQSASQRTLSSYSSSQQAMLPNNQTAANYQHQDDQNEQIYQRNSRSKNNLNQPINKMHHQHHHHHLQAQRNNQLAQQQQHQVAKQRMHQQQQHQQNQLATTQRLNASTGSQLGGINTSVANRLIGGAVSSSASVYGSSSGASAAIAKQQQLKQQQQHQMNKKQLQANNLISSSGDNLTTSSSSEQTTIDDLQQLAHGYQLNNHHHHNHSSSSAVNIAKHVSKLSQYAYGSPGDDDPLSPRLALTGSSLPCSTTSTSTSQSEQNSGSRFLLGVLFTLAEILLFSVLLLWLYWAFQHDDGLAWQVDRKQQFNTHAALMLLGFIFLNGQAMLIYRSFQCCTKIYTKILHTILFVLATSAIGLGLCLAYTAQENVGANNKPIMHFYSLHAWIGLSSISLFTLQFSIGFISFLVLLCCDQATGKFREALLPIHKTFGLIIFSMAISTCLTGLLQTARSRLSSKLGKIDYHELAEAGIVINVIGGCLICLAILMPYIIRNLDIKRPQRRHTRADRRLRLSEL